MYNNEQLINSINELQAMLQLSETNYGATITITVQRPDGRVATLSCYDHAMLVQALQAALDEFEAEL